MKRILLFTFCIHVIAAGAGELQRLYFAQPQTNEVTISDLIGPPKGPSTNHGISEIGIERTPCFGTCPVYTCIIRSNGTVRYVGVAHVERLGTWETKIDPYQYHRVANFILTSRYLEMKDTYLCGVTDADTVYTMIVRAGRRKIFSNYASSGPDSIWVLQHLIDSLVAGSKWRQVSSATK